MAKGIVDVSDSSFDAEILQADKPAVVDFWAPWCGPCKAIGPVIEDLAGTYGEKIKFAKCNVDDNPITPGKYGIKGIPTLIFFKQGKVADQ
ncbi:MAG: thioredoxin, partial [Desulfobacterales bacterium]|nr:thioredoxin [Desulfobacterales bacterium]